MDHELGKHEMSIDISRVPTHVSSLVFVLSAFAGAKLHDIITPEVEFKNVSTNESLCRYNHNIESKTGADGFTAIIMCRLTRTQAKGPCTVKSWRSDEKSSLKQLSNSNAGSNNSFHSPKDSGRPGAAQGWHVQALGEMSMGHAGDYAPILETVQTLW